MQEVTERIAALDRTLDRLRRVAVAVSGGVDSITLAHAAHRRLGTNAVMFHAVSPAVPSEATERTRRHAAHSGWMLEVVDAGEFSDPDYLSNPVNRCFYCKTNLYGTIARHWDGVIASGTNLDDLGDFRPGLQAAKNHDVRHPYVEAGIDKAMVRAIASAFELGEMANLPASPCLSSRIETGIRVDAQKLGLVHAAEQLVGRSLQPATVRCRIRHDGIVIELDGPAYARATAGTGNALETALARLCAERGFPPAARFEPYRMGSAFLRS
jgi:uncharacterized protein